VWKGSPRRGGSLPRPRGQTRLRLRFPTRRVEKREGPMGGGARRFVVPGLAFAMLAALTARTDVLRPLCDTT
jgi:hypothetical protein